MTCELCHQEFSSQKSLCLHLKLKHKLNHNQIQNYYDKYIKKPDEGLCYLCGNKAKFYNFSKGYKHICDSESCLSKSRATNSLDFIINKNNITKEEAEILFKIKKDNHNLKVKETIENKILENKNYYKENSHQTKEYWIKRGCNEKEALLKSKEVMINIHNKTWKKRKENPESYSNINTTQLAYWLKKGLNQEEAKYELSLRQTTFSLEKCKLKYSTEQGFIIWKNRQIKWCNNYKKSNFSKISQKLFWLIYNNLENKNNIYFATINNVELDDSGKNNEYRLQLKTRIIMPDFFMCDKIIEFDGDYYHNIENRSELDLLRDKEIIENGYKVLHIKECDFNLNNEKILKICLEFLNK